MTTAVSNDYAIKDFRFLATDLAIMHARLSGNDEEEALMMRQDMAQDIVDMYSANGSSISMEEAMAMVDEQYKYISGGASVVDTIQETTKSANSFWNYVPIVNLFIDDTTAEDLYKMMDGEKPDIETSEGKLGKTASTTGMGAASGAGIGAAVGTWIFPGIGTGVGAFLGGIIGGVAGFFSGYCD